MIIFGVSIFLDIAGLIYSSVYLGVYVTNISAVKYADVCKESTINSSPSTSGYFYGLDYTISTEVIQNCVDSSTINIG